MFNRQITHSYYAHLDKLNSLVKHLYSQDLFFVTIQPNDPIYTPQEAKQYIDNLFKKEFKAVVQLERNDKVTYGGNYKRYDHLQTLHIHIFTDRQNIDQLTDIIYYANNKELLAYKEPQHIVACPLFNLQRLIKYLTKQFAQGLTPFTINAPIRVLTKLTPIYEKRQMKAKPPCTQTLYALLDLFNFGEIQERKKTKPTSYTNASTYILVTCLAVKTKFVQYLPNDP